MPFPALHPATDTSRRRWRHATSSEVRRVRRGRRVGRAGGRPTVTGTGEVLVQVEAAGINPGEAAIRKGLLHAKWPATFPSGQGSDLAGVVAEVGDGVEGLRRRRRGLRLERGAGEPRRARRDAGEPARPQAGRPAVGRSRRPLRRRRHGLGRRPSGRCGVGDTVVVSGAAGGVGSLTVQLARLAGATVIGLASEPNHGWLREHGVIPVVLRPRSAGTHPRRCPGRKGRCVHRHLRQRLRGPRHRSGRRAQADRHDHRLGRRRTLRHADRRQHPGFVDRGPLRAGRADRRR